MANHLSFYRTTSACQIDFKPPTFNTGKNSQKYLENHGVLFITMTSGKDRVYDWTNKIVVGISISDVPVINEGIANFRKTGELKIELVHDPEAGTDKAKQTIKTMQLQPGKKAGT